MGAANAAAVSTTIVVLTNGADEILATIAALFSENAQDHQMASAYATTFYEQFVQALNSAAGRYTTSEAANVTPLQKVLNAINAPIEAVLEHPLNR